METGNNGGNNKQEFTEQEQWTIRYLVAKHGVTEDLVIEAISKVGNDPKEIEAYLLLKNRGS
jgi:hypothetical protein